MKNYDFITRKGVFDMKKTHSDIGTGLFHVAFSVVDEAEGEFLNDKSESLSNKGESLNAKRKFLNHQGKCLNKNGECLNDKGKFSVEMP